MQIIIPIALLIWRLFQLVRGCVRFMEWCFHDPEGQWLLSTVNVLAMWGCFFSLPPSTPIDGVWIAGYVLGLSLILGIITSFRLVLIVRKQQRSLATSP